MISVCIPSWNRVEMPIQAFEKVYHYGSVSEIVIADDASEYGIFEELSSRCKDMSKVRLYENTINLDCYRNKHRAVSLASNEWVILLDSDNMIDVSYLDRLFQFERWDAHTVYAPDFAMPNFDYRAYSGLEITRENAFAFIDLPMFEVCLNTCNFFVNRDEYLRVWDDSVDPVTSDSIYFNLKWLEAGNKIKIVDGLQYFHRIHEGSHYNGNNHRTPAGFHQSVLNRLKNLR